jgi:hypothetical protein
MPACSARVLQTGNMKTTTGRDGESLLGVHTFRLKPNLPDNANARGGLADLAVPVAKRLLLRLPHLNRPQASKASTVEHGLRLRGNSGESVS